MTIGEELQQALVNAAKRYGNDELAPVVLLWPDPGELWKPVIHRLRSLLPELLTLGAYAPDLGTGPAIWLRCMVAGTLDWTPARVPILYLPGISRGQLRTPQDAPAGLQPLIALQFSGAIWFHTNGKDWTPTAFISSLGIEIASDDATRNSVHERLEKLFDAEQETLLALGRLDSHKIRNLEADWPAAILAWMEQPKLRPAEWTTFCQICRSQYQLDPEKDSEVRAAELLAEADKSWKTVWDRFELAPNRYRQVAILLAKLHPNNLLVREEGYPYCNSDHEQQLRKELERLLGQSAEEIRSAISQLETAHGPRRDWVWAELGQSPLATSLQHLAVVAVGTARVPAGATLESLITAYVNGAWRTDLAALRAYSAVNSQDAPLLSKLLAAIYGPWLAASATTFATLAAHTELRSLWNPEPPPVPGECILFADGLRYDTGQLLMQELEKCDAKPSISHRIVALPGVTPTAKPAVSPVSHQLNGSSNGADFRPLVTATGRELQIKQFRELLAASNVQVLTGTDTGDTAGTAWTEIGTLDSAGHESGADLANRIDDEIKRIYERISALVSAGWRNVRVVTDHGWLWLPGGLPKTELPAYLAETRWGRCAAIKPGSAVSLPTVPWHFNPLVEVAVPTGISCFRAGTEYTHGGLSLQECVTPVLTITHNVPNTPVVIVAARWTGLRCRIEATGANGHYADIRKRLGDAGSSLVHAVKKVNESGTVTLTVDDAHEQEVANVVIYNEEGAVLAKLTTTIGGD